MQYMQQPQLAAGLADLTVTSPHMTRSCTYLMHSKTDFDRAPARAMTPHLQLAADANMERHLHMVSYAMLCALGTSELCTKSICMHTGVCSTTVLVAAS